MQPRICDRVIRADDISVPGWKGRLSLISLLAKGLYQMTTINKGEEGSGIGDVGNKVFADDDVVKEGDIVIKLFHPGKVPG